MYEHIIKHGAMPNHGPGYPIIFLLSSINLAYLWFRQLNQRQKKPRHVLKKQPKEPNFQILVS